MARSSSGVTHVAVRATRSGTRSFRPEHRRRPGRRVLAPWTRRLMSRAGRLVRSARRLSSNWSKIAGSVSWRRGGHPADRDCLPGWARRSAGCRFLVATISCSAGIFHDPNLQFTPSDLCWAPRLDLWRRSYRLQRLAARWSSVPGCIGLSTKQPCCWPTEINRRQPEELRAALSRAMGSRGRCAVTGATPYERSAQRALRVDPTTLRSSTRGT